MVYPPALPPATRSDTTVAAGAHADDHNKIALALAAFLDELGPDLAGSYANLTTRLLGVAAGQDQAAIDAFLANRTAAEAARAAAEALVLSDLGTTDGQTRALVQNPASQTALALSASTAQAIEESTYLPEVFALGADGVEPVALAAASQGASAPNLLFMDRKGRLLRENGVDLEASDDNGTTWAAINTFPRVPIGVRQLDNGELLVSCNDNYPTNTIKSRVYLTSGYETGTTSWTQVLESSGYQQLIDLAWGYGGAGSTYVVSEYDNHTSGRAGTQKVWLSTNSGVTWTMVYDHGTGSPGMRHVHGCAYDPYRDAIWVTLGDFITAGDGNRKIIVSFDHGTTWTTVTTEHQPTAIHVHPDCVTFGSDDPPNGILLIDNPSPTNLALRVVYKINETAAPGTNTLILTHVAERPFRAQTPEGHLLLQPFSAAETGQPGLVLATYDGYTWFEIWRDTRTYGSGGKGAFKAVGPTRGGAILIEGKDASGTGRFSVTIPAPAGPGVLSAVSRISKGAQRAIPRRSIVGYANASGPYQTVTPYNQTVVQLAESPAFVEDPSGLFTRASDGVIVNRDCFATIYVDNCVNVGVVPPRFAVDLMIDGSLDLRTVGSRITIPRRLRAGQKIGTAAFIESSGASYDLSGAVAVAIEVWEANR